MARFEAFGLCLRVSTARPHVEVLGLLRKRAQTDLRAVPANHGLLRFRAAHAGLPHGCGRFFDERFKALDLAKITMGCGAGGGRASAGECPRERQPHEPGAAAALTPAPKSRTPGRRRGLMPVVNHARREVHLKIVYYGPGLGGKTTNLEFIHARSKPRHRGKLISLMSDSERTLFFDLLPVELGDFKGYRIRVHLCTVPGQIAREEIRRQVLRHVDGIVFVVDSQRGAELHNRMSVRDLDANLRLQGGDPDRTPLIVQYNKRDLDNVWPVEELRAILKVPRTVREISASALHGDGVFETLKEIIKECLRVLGDPARANEGRSPSVLPGRRPSMYPEARPPAATSSVPPNAGRSAAVKIPGPPPLPKVRRARSKPRKAKASGGRP